MEAVINNLLYTGLFTSSDVTQQKLSTMINECSRNQYYRLASALRIATNEFTKAMDDVSKVNSKKYAFFLNQSWLLTKGLRKALKDGDKQLFEKFAGYQVKKITVPLVEALVIGVERNVFDNRWINIKIHFQIVNKMRLSKIITSKIVTWSQLYKYNKELSSNAEKVFTHPLKGLDCSLYDIVTSQTIIKLSKWAYASTTNSISTGKDSLIEITEKEKSLTNSIPVFNHRSFTQELSNMKITPLDHQYTLLQYTGFTDINIVAKKKKKNQDFTFKYDTLTFKIQLKNNESDRVLLQKINKIARKSSNIRFLYGILTIEASNLLFTPISTLNITEEGNESFEFLQINLESYRENDYIKTEIKHSDERKAHLALLGDLLGKKKD